MHKWMMTSLSLLSLPAFSGEKFTLESKDLKPKGTIQTKFMLSGMGCTGDNLSPELHWSNPPPGTQSFMLTVYDPDAPTGSGWWHWVVFNLPASTTSLPQGASSTAAGMPVGSVQGRTDFGAPGYGGPCPPAGDKPHRYVFTVHALKVDKLDIPADASSAYVGFMAHWNELGTASFTAKCGRPAIPEASAKPR